MIYAVIDTNVLVAAAKTQIPGRSFDKLRNRLSNQLRNRLSNLLRNRPE